MSTVEVNPPELWILNLEVEEAVDIDPMFPLLITNVALTATAANPNEHTSLQLTYAPAGFHAEKDAIVATLFKHRTDSAKVHIMLEPGLTYTLKALGPNSIDIIGEWQPFPPDNTPLEAELKETLKGKEKEVIKEKPEPRPRNQAATRKTPTESVATTTRSRTKPAATRSPTPQASSSTAATKHSAVQAKKKPAPAQAKTTAAKNPPPGAKKRKVQEKEKEKDE
ncbi:hypothetical protein MD484_g8269, partial [Candolleomyces efflorescens]